MATLSRSGLVIGGATLVIWGLAAGSAGYWALRAWPAGSTVPAAPVLGQTSAPAVDTQAVARLLGATAPVAAVPVSLASRLVLKGLVAAPNGGAALIGVDGQPAKPYRRGSVVVDGLVLQSVAARQVTLAASLDGPALVTLDAPKPARP